jgi:hypothetical protein
MNWRREEDALSINDVRSFIVILSSQDKASALPSNRLLGQAKFDECAERRLAVRLWRQANSSSIANGAKLA